MHIRIIAVGKLKERFWREAAQEYLKRLGAFASVEIIEVAEEKLSENPQPAEIEASLKKEAARIVRLIPDKATVISLAIKGQSFSSKDLAGYIEKLRLGGSSYLVFMIGGSYGLAEEAYPKPELVLSFSAMTFPHQMMRVVLLEQLYRSFQIINKGKYHK